MSLARIVEHHADRSGDSVALHLDDDTLTYSDVRDRARTVAAALQSIGVGRGDVVAVLLHNSFEFVDIMIGASYLGAIFMPLNWRLAAPELLYIVNHAEAVVLVSEAELIDLIEPIQPDLRCRILLTTTSPGSTGWEPFESLTTRDVDLPVPVPTAPNEVARLMYTSGTTARPKGVMITVGNIDAKCFAHTVELGLSKQDRSLVAGPMYHVGALDLTFTTLLYLGGYQHILRRFDAVRTLRAIETHRVTNLWLAPAMVNALVSHPDAEQADMTSVRILIDGGEKMPLPLIERIHSLFPNAWFADAYGLTETVSGDTFLEKKQERHKLGSVGRPVFNTSIAIVDPVNGSPVPAGSAGEIVIRGPKVCLGYWRDPEATAAVIRDGWFHSGDLGMIDDEGYLYIVDRLKDMILSGGENISSLEVERALYEHPAVVEAAVVGRPDPKWGEVPVAYVVVRNEDPVTDDAILEHCRGRLARFKVPKTLRRIETLPRNPSGKVLKRELREREASLP